MIITLLHDPKAPSERLVGWLTKQLDEEGTPYKLIDIDSVEGAATAELYGIVKRTAVIVAQDDGTLVRSWQGDMPPFQDLSYSVHS